MKLFELFDRPLKWEHKESLSDYDSYMFNVEGVGEYQVDFGDISEDEGDVWEVDFMATDTPGSGIGIIGTGGKQVQIFSTVKDIVDDFLLRRGRNVKQLVFSAKEPSRAKFYRRFAKLFGPHKEEDIEEDGERFTQFTVNV